MGLRSPSWARGIGMRLTIGLAMLVAILSIVTGIANISSQAVVGPFAELIPAWVQRTAGFTGALTGFLMIVSVIGLRRGLRAAWYSTVLLLPVTAGQGLLQWSPLSVPLIVLSGLAFPNLVAHRRRFDRRLSLTSSQLAAITALVGALVYGTVGTYALREEFTNVETLADAFYYTLVTASTVGYGDATPVATSQIGRLFVVTVIVLGTGGFAIALGSLFGPAIEARFSKALGRMTETQLELLEGHLLVLGHGDLTDVIIEELDEREYLVVSDDTAWIEQMRERDLNVLVGDPSDESTLKRAGIDDARAVLVATNDDAEDALSVLTARQLNPGMTIVAAATNRENVEKLRRAGANTVISPASIGGHLLVKSALGAEADVEAVANDLIGGRSNESGE